MSRIHRKGPARIEANLTPMIDMTFLLVVFFVLVSTISEVESIEMELPEPRPTASAPPSDDPRAVINVIPGERGKAMGYRLNGVDFELGAEGIEGLRGRVRELYLANSELLEILAKAKDVRSMQPFYRKCFEGANTE